MPRIPEYKGKITHSNNRTIAYLAAISFKAQLRRCYNKESKDYRWYGAKGIKVEYTKRQYMYWYIKEYKRLNLTNPSISRIDHNKNYSFGNIKLEEHRENCIESMKRNLFKRSKQVIAKDIDGSVIGKFESIRSAARILNLEQAVVSRIVAGRYKYCRNGITFERINSEVVK